MTHPFSIFIFQPTKGGGGTWIEPVQVYTQHYAIYLANLIYQDTKSVIKVVRYGLTLANFPDKETVDRVERYLAKNGYTSHRKL